MATITFGKYKGTELEAIPTDYLEWGVEKLDSPKWRQAFNTELKRRNQVDKQQRQQLKANIDSPETFKFLVDKAKKELNEEIANSGCEWEYDNLNFGKECEKRAKEELAELKKEIELENLEKEFIGREELTKELLKKIEGVYYEYGLKRKQFSTDAKYQVAVEYMQKLEAIRGF